MYLGDFALGAPVVARFDTSDPTGALVTLAGSPSARVRKGSGAGTTITTGVTLTVDVITGQHVIDVDTSSGYAAGFDYTIELVAGTVNGVSQAGRIVKQFSLENRSALRPLTAGRTLVVDASGLADANAVKVGPTGAGTAQTAGDIISRLSPLATKTFTVNDAGASTTVFITDLTETDDNYWKDSWAKITSGALINQVKKISAYNGTTKAITVQGGFTAAPANGVTGEVVND